MPFQPADNIAQATIHMDSDGQSIQHSMYFLSGDGWSGGEIIQLAQAFAEAWETNMMPLYPEAVTALFAVAVDQESLEGSRAIFQYPDAVAGGVAQQPTANNVAFAIQLGTGSRGRGANGRLFIGPLPETVVNGNLVTSAHADALVDAINATGNAVEAEIDLECTWVVLSRYENGEKRVNAIGRPVIAPAYSNLYLDSQKLRLPFHKKRKSPTT